MRLFAVRWPASCLCRHCQENNICRTGGGHEWLLYGYQPVVSKRPGNVFAAIAAPAPARLPLLLRIHFTLARHIEVIDKLSA